MNKKLIFLTFLVFLSSTLLVSAQTCSGSPITCSSYNGNQASCVAAGCNYNSNNNKCLGNPNSCSAYSNQASCEAQSCTWTAGATCGNGAVESGEGCDDGDTSSGDGCSSTCTVESGWSCSGEPSTCTESSTPSTSETTTTTDTSGDGFQSVVGLFTRGPLGGDSIYYGDLKLKTQVYFGNNPTSNADVLATSDLFGEIFLDRDPEEGQGYYSATVPISSDTKPGIYRIFYKATVGSDFTESTIQVNLQDSLSISLDELLPEYSKGKSVTFSGNVLDLEGLPANDAFVNIEGYSGENKVFSVTSLTLEDGTFSIPYFIKFADPEGTLRIVAKAYTEDGLTGFDETNLFIQLPGNIAYYLVSYLSPLQENQFSRGESVPISIQVLENGIPVEGANVKTYIFENEGINLEEVEPGIYSGEYRVEPNDDLGDVLLRTEAIKQIGSLTKVGSASIPLEVTSTQILFSPLSPETEVIYTNSRLKITTELRYSDGTPVRGATMSADLSTGATIRMLERTDGVYEAEYFITNNDIGTLEIQLSAYDADKNEGILEQTLFVRQRSAVGNILAYAKDWSFRYWWAIAMFFVLALIITRPNIEFGMANRRLRSSVRAQKEIKSMQIELEKKYYNKGSISKKEFKDMNSDYEQRMIKARESEKEAKEKIKSTLSKYKKLKSEKTEKKK